MPIILDIEDDSPETQESKSLEIKAIQQAESGDSAGALLTLNQAITLTSNRPSLYNNRAQVYQFQGKLDEAFRDLTKAIELSGDTYKKTRCKALCQRGILFRKNDLLEEAKVDFNGAAKLGSKFAKSQLVEMNPYAAMCNQVLKRIMDETNQISK